jgi:excisionase family DNA binding protein
MPDELTTKQTADILGITPRRVLALIHAGRLPAEKHGRDWAIKPEDLKLVKERKPGRPFKPSPTFRETGTTAIMISRRRASSDEQES